MTAAAQDLTDWLRLAAVPGLGAERQRSLLAAFGLPRHIFAAGRSALAAVVGRELADAVLAPAPTEDIERALAWAAEPGSHVLTLADEAYPRTLLDIADPPPLLYVKGDPALLQRPAIALVGARSATAQGEASQPISAPPAECDRWQAAPPGSAPAHRPPGHPGLGRAWPAAPAPAPAASR